MVGLYEIGTHVILRNFARPNWLTALIVSLDGDLVHEPEREGADPHVPEVHQSHQERHVGPAHLNNAHNSAYGISCVLECSKKGIR